MYNFRFHPNAFSITRHITYTLSTESHTESPTYKFIHDHSNYISIYFFLPHSTDLYLHNFYTHHYLLYLDTEVPSLPYIRYFMLPYLHIYEYIKNTHHSQHSFTTYVCTPSVAADFPFFNSSTATSPFFTYSFHLFSISHS